jgi:tRNA pseudouridine55 synthase
VAGRKLYELARKGETVAVEPKTVRVTALSLGPLANGLLPFSVSCSSGTYIRSIAAELGEKLGCGAHLESLRRTRIGSFDAADAIGLEEFEKSPPETRVGSPHTVALSRVRFPFERIRVASLEAWKLRKGQSIPLSRVPVQEGDWVTLVGPGDEMVAIGQIAPIGHGGNEPGPPQDRPRVREPRFPGERGIPPKNRKSHGDGPKAPADSGSAL